MGKIKDNADPGQDSPDGVEAGIKCVLTQFEKKSGAKKTIQAQSVMPCRMRCAYSLGTISFSIGELDLMVTVRLDEVIELLNKAADAAQAPEASLHQEYDDAELETRWHELGNTPLDEADSPSGQILAAPWWIFPQGVDRLDIWKWFDKRHSKGVAYLQYGKESEQI